MGGRRQRWRLDPRSWRFVLAAVVLVAVLITGYEAWHGVPRALASSVGRLGVDWVKIEQGRRRVAGMQDWSPLRAAGVAVGDVIVAERWYDLERSLQPGEALRLGVETGTGLRPITLRAVAGPHPSLAIRLFVLVQAVTCFAGIAFGALIGWRLAHSVSGRALALAFVFLSINLYPGASPPGWPQQIEQLAFSLALTPGWFALAVFAVLFPDDEPTHLRARLKRVLPALGVLGLGAVAVTAWRGLGLGDRLFIPSATGYSVISGSVVIACLIDGWRRQSGAQRRRLAWMLATFGLMVVPSWFPAVAEQLGWTFAGWLFVAMSACSLAGLVGLAYAALRHRVIDLGVVFGRSLALAAGGLLVFGAIKLIELSLAHLARPAQPLMAALIGAGLAVLGLVAYRVLRPRAAALMDRVLFPRWTARVQALRRCVDEAGAAADAATLATSFVQAVEAFARGCAAAIYVEEQGRFRRLASSRDGAPELLPPDDAALVALRRQADATSRHGAGIEAGARVLPMTRRAGAGLVLRVRRLPDSPDWDDDDLRVIGTAALDVGQEQLWLLFESARAPGMPSRPGAG